MNPIKKAQYLIRQARRLESLLDSLGRWWEEEPDVLEMIKRDGKPWMRAGYALRQRMLYLAKAQHLLEQTRRLWPSWAEDANALLPKAQFNYREAGEIRDEKVNALMYVVTEFEEERQRKTPKVPLPRTLPPAKGDVDDILGYIEDQLERQWLFERGHHPYLYRDRHAFLEPSEGWLDTVQNALPEDAEARASIRIQLCNFLAANLRWGWYEVDIALWLWTRLTESPPFIPGNRLLPRIIHTCGAKNLRELVVTHERELVLTPITRRGEEVKTIENGSMGKRLRKITFPRDDDQGFNQPESSPPNEGRHDFENDLGEPSEDVISLGLWDVLWVTPTTSLLPSESPVHLVALSEPEKGRRSPLQLLLKCVDGEIRKYDSVKWLTLVIPSFDVKVLAKTALKWTDFRNRGGKIDVIMTNGEYGMPIEIPIDWSDFYLINP